MLKNIQSTIKVTSKTKHKKQSFTIDETHPYKLNTSNYTSDGWQLLTGTIYTFLPYNLAMKF